jgi:hypothetical protein
MEIKLDLENSYIVSQTEPIDHLLSIFGMQDCHIAHPPASSGILMHATDENGKLY